MNSPISALDNVQIWLGTAITLGVTILAYRYRASVLSPKVQGDSAHQQHPTLADVVNAPLSKVIREEVKGPIRVSKILVHPVKSCKGTSVLQARYTPVGLEYDRKWAIVDAKTHVVITARDISTMLLINPTICMDPTLPLNDVLRILFPEKSELSSIEIPLNPSQEVLDSWECLTDVSIWTSSGLNAYVCQSISKNQKSPSEAISTFLGRDVYLVIKGPIVRPCDPTPRFNDLGTASRPATVEFQDGYPLLIASTESLAETSKRVRGAIGVVSGVGPEWGPEGQKELEMERFRPNIVLEGAGQPFTEDEWEEIEIKSRDSEPHDIITLVSRCTRCLLPNVDPSTGIRDAAVPFKVLGKFRTKLDPRMPSKSCFGVNGVPSGNGTVRVGDEIVVRKWVQE